MRSRMVYCTCLLLYSILISATAQPPLKKIYLQPKTVAREKQSKYLDSIRFIPLEIKEGVELGAYYNIDVTEKYLLVNDYSNKRLLVYSKDGRFVKSIKYNKLGGDFYPAYQERTNQIIFFGTNKSYTLTPKDQIKIKLDWDNPRNRKYFKKYTIDLNDSLFSIKKDVPDEKDIVRVYHFYDDYYAQVQISTSFLYKDSLDYELKLYKNNQLLKSFFPYNRVNEPRFLYSEQNATIFNKTNTPYTSIVSRPYCDTIYRMVKDSIFAYYQVVLPLENSLPSSFFTKPFKNKTERDNFNRNNAMIFQQVYSFYETPRFIYFLVRFLSNFDSYIYEKQTDVTYKTKNIRADSSQYSLPLIADYGNTRKADKFYKPLRASDLLPFFEKNKNAPVPKELEAFLASKPPATTPVIVEFKFKN